MNGRQASMGTWKRDYRDEDLALFHDMRKRERKNFLILPAEDAEASPMSTPTRTGRELLAVDSEKNDFDWLLTPPSTPLFPLLERDGPVVNLSQRRVRNKSASISRTTRLSYVQEPSPKLAGCGNPSPKRQSTASSTSSTVSTSRGRPLSPSSYSRSSPTLRSSSPCRPVTPTQRNSGVSCRRSSRSLTPTLQRNSFSSSSANGAGRLSGRSRGKSSSPRLCPWEPYVPGFPADPPPNLRTTLSERTVQRGVMRSSKKKTNARSCSADMFDGSGQSHWHLDSPCESRNWSSSYSIDHSSPQNSRASVASHDDVDIAESVLSGSTSSDVTLKCVNIVSPKMEETSLRRSVLPAKRHMKSAECVAGPVPFLSAAARKSYERQTTQRSNAQAMFRPLLSSAPVSSFYDSRTSGMRFQSSGPSDSSATQSSSFREPRTDNSPGEAPTVNYDANEDCKSVCECQEAIKEENVSDSVPDEETSRRWQGGCCPRASEERLAGPKGQRDNTADAHKVSNCIDAGTHTLTPAKGNDGPQIPCEITDVLPAQCLMQRHQGRKPQSEDRSCPKDFEFSNLSKSTECHVIGQCTYQEKKSCVDEHAVSSIAIDISKKRDLKPSESQVKEKYVDEQMLVDNLDKTSYLGGGNALSQIGSQRVLGDLGSFKKQSPVKSLHAHSQNSLLLGEKNGICTSSISDSYSVTVSLPSASGSDQLVHLENTGGSVVESMHLGSIAMVDNTHHRTERVSLSLERDSSKKEVPFCIISTGAINASSEIDAVSESYLESCSFEMGSMNMSMSEVSCGSLEKNQAQASTSYNVTEQDDLTGVSSCVGRITAIIEDGVQHGCTEAGCCEASKRSIYADTAAGLSGEDSHADTLTPTQASGVPLSKRSVTLEEATDTILFCSSIVHELVYKAASVAIDNEEQRIPKPSISRRDFVALFGYSGSENRPDNISNGLKTATVARNRMHRPFSNEMVRETSSSVQKQRMMHRQTPALTMRQSPMGRIENTIIGNHEKVQTPTAVLLTKKKMKQRSRRCSCCMM